MPRAKAVAASLLVYHWAGHKVARRIAAQGTPAQLVAAAVSLCMWEGADRVAIRPVGRRVSPAVVRRVDVRAALDAAHALDRAEQQLARSLNGGRHA